MASLRELDIEVGAMLSEHDLELASLRAQTGHAGCRARHRGPVGQVPLNAARRAGGQIVAGERIPASRVEAALGDRHTG